MKDKRSIAFLAILGIFALGAPRTQAAGIVIYPDLVVYNAKVVTVDDVSFNPSVGTIAEAMAIKDGKILLVGSNAQIRDTAGPNTRQIDLKGRMVMPGIINTHDHPNDWDPLNPKIVQKVISDDIEIERFLQDPPEEQLQRFPRVLEAAVLKAKPGQWIRISLLYGEDFSTEYRNVLQSALGTRITKQQLDLAAPNNPVIVRAGFVGMVLNQKAIDETKKVYYGDLSKMPFSWVDTEGNASNALDEVTGLGTVSYRQVETDVMWKDRVDLIAEIYRYGLEWLAGNGITTFNSLVHAWNSLTAYRMLDRQGTMAARMGWGYGASAKMMKSYLDDPYLLADLTSREGEGTDYIWFTGSWGGHNQSRCTTLPGTSPEVKAREGACHLAPGTVTYQNSYALVKHGARLNAYHQMGDRDTDYVLDLVEKASQEAGLTIDQIKARRHIPFDHGDFVRPDQAERAAELGMIGGTWDFTLWESADQRFKDYGERGSSWHVPRKTMVSAGLMNTFEIDRPLGYTNLNGFTVLGAGLTRKGQDGRVYAPEERIDRQTMLKVATIWGAYYMLREDLLGSLEAGKFADFIVLDKDYMTIPEDQIKNIRVLMAVLGGKTVHLVPSLAREIGMQPAGAQVELGGPGSRY